MLHAASTNPVTTPAGIELRLDRLSSPPPALIQGRLPTRRVIMEPMKHLSINLLERYVMQDISSRDQRRVERHVMRCPECLDRLHSEVGWVLGVRSWDRMRKKLVKLSGKSPAKNE